MPEVAKDTSSKASEKTESAEASGSEAEKKKAKLKIALDTSEKPAPIVGPTKENKSPMGSPTREKKKSPMGSPTREKKKSPLVSPSQEKRSPLVSPSQEKRSPLVSPTQEKRSPLVSPTQEKKSPMMSPSSEQKSPLVSPSSEQKSPLVSPSPEQKSPLVSSSPEQKSPLVSPTQKKKFPLGKKVPEKEGEFVKPATGESVTNPKIKQVGAPDPTTPSSLKVMVPGFGAEYDSGVKQKSSETVEPTSDRSSSIPAVDVEGTGTGEEKVDDGMYRCMFYMKHFRVDDISIQIDGQTVLIDAKHGYQVDEHGFVTREFVRKHVLPENVIVDKFTSCFIDGVLIIQAPHSKI